MQYRCFLSNLIFSLKIRVLQSSVENFQDLQHHRSSQKVNLYKHMAPSLKIPLKADFPENQVLHPKALYSVERYACGAQGTCITYTNKDIRLCTHPYTVDKMVSKCLAFIMSIM